MKIKSLSVLAGIGAPLILTGSAPAGFVGIETVSKPNEFGLFVCNVYAVFDRPGEDHMVAVAGTPLNPMDIQVQGGTFFQQGFGGDKAPNPSLILAFPSLAFDSFVTIGVKSFDPNNPGDPLGQPEDALVLTPTWPGFGPSSLAMTTDGWAITPDNAQGNPFNSDFIAGNGSVLIAQFSGNEGTTGIGGQMLVQYVSNGVPGSQLVSFFHVPAPGALALLGTAGLVGARRRRRR